MKIAIFTRSMNYALFLRMKKTLTLPYPHHRYLYTTGDGYFYRMLQSDDDIAINIDEDAFVINNDRLERLLEYFLERRYVLCGMPDGGVVGTRHDNPLVVNPFFNIIDLRVIRKSFDRKNLQEYAHWNPDWERLFPRHLIHLPYETNIFECYYPFFIWMGVNFPTLYLNAQEHTDKISTVLMDHENQPLLCHSWFSREYGILPEHTDRINALFAECCSVPWREEEFENAKTMKKIAMEKFIFDYGYRNFLRCKVFRNNVLRKIGKIF